MDEGVERQLAADLFNGVWELLERPDRGAAEDDRQLLLADLATIPGQPRFR